MDPESIGTESVDTSAEVTAETSGPVETTTGGNPAWEPLRSKLDPVTFKLIEPELKNWDKQAETRVSNLNTQLKEYTALGKPDQLRNYATIAQRLDADPEAIYTALGQFLQQNGRLPQTQQEVQQVQDGIDDGDEYTDPRLAQLEQQQEQIRQFLAHQEQERAQQAADQELETEIGQLKEQFKEFSDQDIQEVIMRAAFRAQTTGQVPALAQIAQDYLDNTVNRIRAIPRAGDSAPRLLPSGGGGLPQQAQQASMGQRSRGEIQDLVAGILRQSR